MGVEVLHSITELNGVALDFQFNESFSPSEEFIHRLTRAKLEKNINIVSVFEEMLKADNTRMMKRSVDFYFTH